MEISSIILSALCLILLIFLLLKSNKDATATALKSELKDNRTELSSALKDNREELSTGLDKLTQKLEEKLNLISQGLNKNDKDNRQELTQSLKNFSEVFTQNVKEFNDLQKQKFDSMANKQDELVKSTELKLEKMRETVDEKLHKTLEERLGQSFKIVSERLEAVQKGLGEMQNLASGVGDLKKVLTNVKTRGVLGEMQLGNLLEDVLTPDQYGTNVKTKKNSNANVEFAIKLPGKDDNQTGVYLPIDAKFPQEDYIRLQTAYEEGDKDGVIASKKALVQSIKKFAKDIKDKYIDPPHTTDFGIMFLPIEGLFAEVVRQPDLITILRREYKIILTGPTTLAVILNSLQIGFKTLKIEKRSSEVWDILRDIKTEFEKFGGVLEKAQKKIHQANEDLDTLIGTRTNKILSKLKKVEELPITQSVPLLENSIEIKQENNS